MTTPDMLGSMLVVDVRYDGLPIKDSPLRMRICAAALLRDKPLQMTRMERADWGDMRCIAIGPNDRVAVVHDKSGAGWDYSQNELALLSADATRELWRVKACFLFSSPCFLLFAIHIHSR